MSESPTFSEDSGDDGGDNDVYSSQKVGGDNEEDASSDVGDDDEEDASSDDGGDNEDDASSDNGDDDEEDASSDNDADSDDESDTVKVCLRECVDKPFFKKAKCKECNGDLCDECYSENREYCKVCENKINSTTQQDAQSQGETDPTLTESTKGIDDIALEKAEKAMKAKSGAEDITLIEVTRDDFQQLIESYTTKAKANKESYHRLPKLEKKLQPRFSAEEKKAYGEKPIPKFSATLVKLYVHTSDQNSEDPLLLIVYQSSIEKHYPENYKKIIEYSARRFLATKAEFSSIKKGNEIYNLNDEKVKSLFSVGKMPYEFTKYKTLRVSEAELTSIETLKNYAATFPPDISFSNKNAPNNPTTTSANASNPKHKSPETFSEDYSEQAEEEERRRKQSASSVVAGQTDSIQPEPQPETVSVGQNENMFQNTMQGANDDVYQNVSNGASSQTSTDRLSGENSNKKRKNQERSSDSDSGGLGAGETTNNKKKKTNEESKKKGASKKRKNQERSRDSEEETSNTNTETEAKRTRVSNENVTLLSGDAESDGLDSEETSNMETETDSSGNKKHSLEQNHEETESKRRRVSDEIVTLLPRKIEDPDADLFHYMIWIDTAYDHVNINEDIDAIFTNFKTAIDAIKQNAMFMLDDNVRTSLLNNRLNTLRKTFGEYYIHDVSLSDFEETLTKMCSKQDLLRGSDYKRKMIIRIANISLACIRNTSKKTKDTLWTFIKNEF